MKKILTVAALALVLCSTSCIGPNNLFRGLHKWNTEATDSKWWNGVIHAGLWILPVYQVTLLGDIVVFNTIEFFGGKNPFSEPGEPKPQSER